jgi:hypothetical protein
MADTSLYVMPTLIRSKFSFVTPGFGNSNAIAVNPLQTTVAKATPAITQRFDIVSPGRRRPFTNVMVTRRGIDLHHEVTRAYNVIA